MDGDINDVELLTKLFEVCQFTHIVHMAAQVGRSPNTLRLLGWADRAAACVFSFEGAHTL